MKYARLIVDANIVFSALIRDSLTRKLLIEAPLYYFSPSIIADEINEKIDLISEKNSLSKKQNLEILNHLLGHITLVEPEYYIKMIPKAVEIMDKIDINDSPYIALALSLRNDGIWTEDKDFEKQDIVQVYKTKDVLSLI